MQHFLDQQGDIPKQMPKEARELASFHALVVDATTRIMPSILQPISDVLKEVVMDWLNQR